MTPDVSLTDYLETQLWFYLSVRRIRARLSRLPLGFNVYVHVSQSNYWKYLTWLIEGHGHKICLIAWDYGRVSYRYDLDDWISQTTINRALTALERDLHAIETRNLLIPLQ